GGLSNLIADQQSRLEIGAGGRLLQFAAASFDAAVWEAALALSSGACLVLARADERSGEPLLRLLRERRVTHTLLPPAVLPTLRPEGLALECLVVARRGLPRRRHRRMDPALPRPRRLWADRGVGLPRR
ncbi:AMP-binding protein, partial [Methylocystis sp. IM4]|uniref:AMP-binding protein n=1 Tax=Methylocystis sp. IM4 TaxID=3136560 RepID=UPI00311914C3